MSKYLNKLNIVYTYMYIHLSNNINIYKFILVFLYITYIFTYQNISLCNSDSESLNEATGIYDNNNSDKKLDRAENAYVPYRPGLQRTTEGYRYEMEGNDKRFEIEGRAINYHPDSHDATRNVNYNEFYKQRNNAAVDNVGSSVDWNEGNVSTTGWYEPENIAHREAILKLTSEMRQEREEAIKRNGKKEENFIFGMFKNIVKEDFRKVKESAAKSKGESSRANAGISQARDKWRKKEQAARLERTYKK